MSQSGLFGRDHRGADRDGILVTPTAVGAVPFWWSQTADEISLGVGESTRWVVARDDRGVVLVHQLVDAVVFGRVEIGRGVHGVTHRVSLADGTVLEDRSDSVDGSTEWTWAPAYIQRRDLLQQVDNAMTRLVGRAGSGDPWGRSVRVDAELSAGIEAYVNRLSGPLSGMSDLEGVAAVAVHRSPEQLLAEVRSVIHEMNRVPLAEAGGDLGTEVRLISVHMTVRHPEISRPALGALLSRWAWANR
ncbi:hypothetical protein HP550_19695 [Cellulomonas humilata]|uniref:Uncharacterized protein n=1 Tax=Cellulomonas humilata TaxID=144055 RepID=A0A7Y6DZ96_9CELL|nr:hypothetical protein [Cellulomonas humilata]NUU19478.1 hypothetical protein [Cellulomonas humilata]